MNVIESCPNGRYKTEIGDKFILVYSGTTILMASFTGGMTESVHTTIVFEDAQSLVNHALEIGLDYTLDHVMDAMEFGVPLRADIEAWFLSQIWDADDSQIERAMALGFTPPEDPEL